MDEQDKGSEAAKDEIAPKVWERPGLRKMEAAEAEAGFRLGGDGTTSS